MARLPYNINMGGVNIIRKNIRNPLTDKDSGFYLAEYGTGGLSYAKVDAIKKNPLFPRARFIYVVKSWESPNRYKLLGTYRRSRYYGIGILTDENRFYYNEYMSKQTALVKTNCLDLERIFLDGFVIDGNTKITISKNITEKNEPMYLYLNTIAKVFGIHIRRRDTVRTLNLANNYLGKPLKSKKHPELKLYTKGHLKKWMLERGYLNFLPDDLYEKITDANTKLRTKNLILMCALGIITMFKADKIVQSNRRRRERLKTV